MSKQINLKGDVKLTARTSAEDGKAQLGKSLIHVCHYNQLEKAKALVAKGADPNYRNLWGETPIYAAAGSGGLEVFEYLSSLGCTFDTKTSGNQTLLHNAVATGDVNVAKAVATKALPQWGAQAYDGSTILMVAVRSGHLRMVRWITQQQDKKMIMKADYSGWNALHHAAIPYRLNRRFDIIDLLVGAGISLNEATYRDDTVVHLCARRGNPLLIAHLIDAGGKIGCNQCETGATSCNHVDKKTAAFMRQMRAAYKKREEEEGKAKPGFFSSLFGGSKKSVKPSASPSSPELSKTSSAPTSPPVSLPSSSPTVSIPPSLSSPAAASPESTPVKGGASDLLPNSPSAEATSPAPYPEQMSSPKPDKKEKKSREPKNSRVRSGSMDRGFSDSPVEKKSPKEKKEKKDK